MNASWLAAARASWRWRGQDRPPFAHPPKPGQTSVWDHPRPPALVPDSREIVIKWGNTEVARTRNAVKLLETSHPPTFYIPLSDVRRDLLRPASGNSYCEWKGPCSYVLHADPFLRQLTVRRYWSLHDGDRVLPRIAWSYPEPLEGAESIADKIAFYATGLHCTVGGEVATPQAGGFYGGWITSDLAGPFKGEPGSSGW